jgi:DNA-directed RNA polymerase specialized sigma subunit
MKKYSTKTYSIYKNDTVFNNNTIFDLKKQSREDLIIMFLPLVEKIASGFSTNYSSSGIMDKNDLIQEGIIGLSLAIDKINWVKINDSNDKKIIITSFVSKRIKGSIRRAIDINRSHIKIPEHKLIEIRKNPDDFLMVEMYFNSMFQSLDVAFNSPEAINNDNYFKCTQYEDKFKEYSIDILNSMLFNLFEKYLTKIESDILNLCFGLDGDKCSAKEIATIVGINGTSYNVKISELKKSAIQKLAKNIDKFEFYEFL